MLRLKFLCGEGRDYTIREDIMQISKALCGDTK